MTKSPFFAAFAAIVLCGLLFSAVIAWQNTGYPNYGQNGQPSGQPAMAAQQQQPQTQRMVPPVALLDVGRILEQNSRLKAEKERLINDMKQADEGLVQRQNDIRSLQQQLRDMTPGTPAYKNLESDVARKASEFEVDYKLQQKNFSEQRAKLLFNAYTEIEQEVQSVAMERGFIMVLRFSGEAVPQDQLQAVYAYAGKPVVWFNKGLDITNIVIDRLERRAAYGNTNVSNAQGRPSVPAPPTRR